MNQLSKEQASVQPSRIKEFFLGKIKVSNLDQNAEMEFRPGASLSSKPGRNRTDLEMESHPEASLLNKPGGNVSVEPNDLEERPTCSRVLKKQAPIRLQELSAELGRNSPTVSSLTGSCINLQQDEVLPFHSRRAAYEQQRKEIRDFTEDLSKAEGKEREQMEGDLYEHQGVLIEKGVEWAEEVYGEGLEILTAFAQGSQEIGRSFQDFQREVESLKSSMQEMDEVSQRLGRGALRFFAQARKAMKDPEKLEEVLDAEILICLQTAKAQVQSLRAFFWADYVRLGLELAASYEHADEASLADFKSNLETLGFHFGFFLNPLDQKLQWLSNVEKNMDFFWDNLSVQEKEAEVVLFRGLLQELSQFSRPT